MSEREAVTKTIATRYRRADNAGERRILDELCATTGRHRDHARKALQRVLRPTIVKPRAPRPPKYGPRVVAALIFCWAVLGMLAGKRLARILPELVPILRGCGELDVDDTATLNVCALLDSTIAPVLIDPTADGRSSGRSHRSSGASVVGRARADLKPKLR